MLVYTENIKCKTVRDGNFFRMVGQTL
uniref:Uncharacterized protein n=1 Tax=Arundo donax TaxID=35708 RepID=A0A0A9F3W6_ARUDO